jgi:Ca2+-binding EF-hand superfamily protein
MQPVASSPALMKLLLLPALAAALFLSACATTPPAGDAALMNLFRQADADRDGKISRKEFTDFMITEAFANYDKNGNGSITLEEWTTGGGTPATFRAMGGTSGRGLTLEQVKASKIAQNQMALPFDGADKSRSGYLTLAEFIAFRQAAAPYVR